ncbi:MAG: hypothetical protein KKC01_04460 [Gammaproteobacteria bacterium]|nr:hypothetical protein [Gammaproteobacteria bacterium]
MKNIIYVIIFIISISSAWSAKDFDTQSSQSLYCESASNLWVCDIPFSSGVEHTNWSQTGGSISTAHSFSAAGTCIAGNVNVTAEIFFTDDSTLVLSRIFACQSGGWFN